MNSALVFDGNISDFLERCKAYDVIDAAFAAINPHLEIIYQNESFNKIATPRNRQLALIHPQNLILSDSTVSQAIKEVFNTGKYARTAISIPFNSSLNFSVTLNIRPVVNTVQQLLCVLICIEEESINKTLTARMQTQEKLRTLSEQIQKLSKTNIENKALISALLTKTPFGLMIIDDNEQVIQLNQSASKLLSTEAQNAIGKHCSSFFNCHQLYDYCPVLDNNEELQPQEISTCNLKPTDKILLKSSAKITFDNRPAVLEAFVDISEKIQYERDLLDAIINSEKANVVKTEFLSNMSHELRTPLHAILGFSRLGESKVGLSAEKAAEYFNKIKISGTTLLNLLNNLLDLSKLEAGKMPLKLSPGSLNEAVNQVTQEFQALNQEKNLHINLKLDKNLGEVNCDFEKLKQVVRNLIGNAIKFSPNHGKIDISTSLNKDHQEFIIENDGPSIPEDELETIFNKFIQSSKTKTGAGGTGLGLSICREIILLHKGEIKALPSEKGGKFIFRLPQS